jgi:hypothetical protein
MPHDDKRNHRDELYQRNAVKETIRDKLCHTAMKEITRDKLY